MICKKCGYEITYANKDELIWIPNFEIGKAPDDDPERRDWLKYNKYCPCGEKL